MIVITAIDDVYSLENNQNIKLFLAGGITNCLDWQIEIIERMKQPPSNRGEKEKYPNLTVYNPRRKNFPINDPKASEEQITWEFEKLKQSNIISFWFSKGSLNPISLYELGMWGNSRNTEVVVGIDPEYERKNDVIIQTKLARPYIKPVFSIEELESKIFEMYKITRF